MAKKTKYEELVQRISPTPPDNWCQECKNNYIEDYTRFIEANDTRLKYLEFYSCQHLHPITKADKEQVKNIINRLKNSGVRCDCGSTEIRTVYSSEWIISLGWKRDSTNYICKECGSVWSKKNE